jgi:hypothetical protein
MISSDLFVREDEAEPIALPYFRRQADIARRGARIRTGPNAVAQHKARGPRKLYA